MKSTTKSALGTWLHALYTYNGLLARFGPFAPSLTPSVPQVFRDDFFSVHLSHPPLLPPFIILYPLHSALYLNLGFVWADAPYSPTQPQPQLRNYPLSCEFLNLNPWNCAWFATSFVSFRFVRFTSALFERFFFGFCFFAS